MNNLITSLRLRQFRSYEDFAVELLPSVNIVVGPNASGKTNLLEAVLLLSGSSTYRANWTDVIKFNKNWARIEASLTGKSRSLAIENNQNSIKKIYTINEHKRQRLRFEDIMPVVLFEPENMRMLTGSPELRRDFLDDILSLIDPVFASSKKQYLRVLIQRNKLLKQNPKSINSQMFVWNIRLSELAGYIVGSRLKLLDTLNGQISDIYSEVAGKNNTVVIKYQTGINTQSYESSLLSKLESSISLDIDRGFTGNGPHREDFTVLLKGATAKTSASRGETRTLVVCLKLIEADLIHKKRSIPPLILLDDVFSELDGSRRKALTHYLRNYQTIITTTDADVIAKDFAQSSTLISL